MQKEDFFPEFSSQSLWSNQPAFDSKKKNKIRGWYPKPLCFKRFYIWSYILQTESFIHTKYIEAFAYQCSGHWPLADAVPFYPGWWNGRRALMFLKLNPIFLVRGSNTVPTPHPLAPATESWIFFFWQRTFYCLLKKTWKVGLARQ